MILAPFFMNPSNFSSSPTENSNIPKTRAPEMIILITQDADLARRIQTPLEFEGFDVLQKGTARDAQIEIFQNDRVVTIIFDYQQAASEGIHNYLKIKELENGKFVPLVAIIEKNQMAEQITLFEMGVDDFIFLPFNTIELQMKIRSIQRLISLTQSLKTKEAQIENFKNLNRVIGTLNHYINNALTPLYSLAQMTNPENPQEARRLKELTEETAAFIGKVLNALRNMTQQRELKVVQEGVYQDVMFDIEQELNRLTQTLH